MCILMYIHIYIYNICKSRRATNRSTTFKIAGNCSRVSYFLTSISRNNKM